MFAYYSDRNIILRGCFFDIFSNCQREGCLFDIFTFSQTVEKTLKRDSIVEFKNTNQQTLPLIN